MKIAIDDYDLDERYMAISDLANTYKTWDDKKQQIPEASRNYLCANFFKLVHCRQFEVSNYQMMESDIKKQNDVRTASMNL